MLKRLFVISVFATMLAIVLPFTANADVLIEPRNDFFERHINELVFSRRDYYTNGRNGFVTVLPEPGSNREIARIDNGEIHQIQYTYNYNGRLWGVFDVEEPGKAYQDWQRGWVPIDDLLVVYDSFSFEEEYQQELSMFNGSIDALFEVQELVFWKWPGSGVIVGSWDESMLTDPNWDFRAWWSEFPGYEDSEGRQWIAFPSMVKEWICLSDPSNRDIPAFFPAPEPTLRQPGDIEASAPGDNDTPTPGDIETSAPGGLPLPVLIIILVAAVVIATVVLVRVFWKKNKA